MSSPTKFWEGLAEAVERPDMLDQSEFADRASRIENYDEVVAFLGPIFKTRSIDEWCERLGRLEVPHSPVYASNEVLKTDHVRHLQLEVEPEHPIMGRFRTIRSPVSFDGERPLDVAPPPVLGEHDREIIGSDRDREAAE